MWKFQKENQNHTILHKLISENCLSFGRSPKLNNRKITHYLSGTRQKVAIFNLYEMRYLLLKVYPLIHNLFLQQRLNVKKKKKINYERFVNFPKVSYNLPKQFRIWENFSEFKNRFNKPLIRNARALLPKILFATTTEFYSAIVISAATKCHMPFHVNRWLSGTITAGSSYLDDFEKWSFFANDFEKDTLNLIQKKFFKNTKKIESQAKKLRKYQLNRKPSLIIIPDVSQNEMIIKEANVFHIPVLGLVSSNCHNEIAYPIFANDFSIYSIHFFCHFLSVLITKEIVKNKHKLSLTPKRKKYRKFLQTLKKIFRFNSRVLKLIKSKKKYGTYYFKYSFKGRYFLDNYSKPRRQVRMKAQSEIKSKLIQKKNAYWKKINLKIQRKANRKTHKKIHWKTRSKTRSKTHSKTHSKTRSKIHWKTHSKRKNKKFKNKNFMILPKKLIFRENQKRLGAYQKFFVLKRRILQKIQCVQRRHHFSVSKVRRQIRIPANKPKFRFWKQMRFFFSSSIRFVTNTNLAFQFQRYIFKLWKIDKKQFWAEKNRVEAFKRKMKRFMGKKQLLALIKKENRNRNRNWNQNRNQNHTKVRLYRKKWRLKKPKTKKTKKQ